jgi:hypothetical protein
MTVPPPTGVMLATAKTVSLARGHGPGLQQASNEGESQR